MQISLSSATKAPMIRTVQLTLSTIRCMVPPAIKPAAHPAAVTANSGTHS